MHHARGVSKTHFPQKVTEFRTLLDLRILPVDTGYTCGGHDSITQQHQHKEMYSIPLRYKERGGKTLRTVYTDLPTGSPTPNHCKEQFMQRHKSQCWSMESKHYYLRRLWEPWTQLAVAALGMSRMHKWVGLFLSFFFFLIQWSTQKMHPSPMVCARIQAVSWFLHQTHTFPLRDTARNSSL